MRARNSKLLSSGRVNLVLSVIPNLPARKLVVEIHVKYIERHTFI